MTENITDGLILRQATTADAAAVAVLFDQYRIFYGQQTDIAGAEATCKSVWNGGNRLFLSHGTGRPGKQQGLPSCTRPFLLFPCRPHGF